MFPQFVKNRTFPCFIRDEHNVKFYTFTCNGITTIKSQQFRMFLSDTCKYLYVAITQKHLVTIAVENDVVNMTLSGVKNCTHTMTNFSNFKYSPLLYLVLFIYDLYRDKYTNLMWYLRKVVPNKPFTTHDVFNDVPFSRLEITKAQTLNECCKMYNCVLDGDSLFPREIFEFPAYKINTLSDLHDYKSTFKKINNLDEENRLAIRDSNINHIFYYNFMNNYYILFEYAILYNRVDFATTLYIRHFLDPIILKKIVRDYPYNDVVQFVYTL